MPSRRFLSLAAAVLIFAQISPALRASAALTGRTPAAALRTPSQPANLLQILAVTFNATHCSYQ